VFAASGNSEIPSFELKELKISLTLPPRENVAREIASSLLSWLRTCYRHILDILSYYGQIMDRSSWTDYGQIMDRSSWTDYEQIMDRSWTDLGQIMDRYAPVALIYS